MLLTTGVTDFFLILIQFSGLSNEDNNKNTSRGLVRELNEIMQGKCSAKCLVANHLIGTRQ